MAGPSPGLYEALVTEALQERLRELDERLEARRRGLRPAEAADRLSLHVGQLVERVVRSFADADRVARGVALVHDLVTAIEATVEGADVRPDLPLPMGEVLRAILAKQPDGSAEEIEEPLIPLLDTTLLTNAPGEPRVGHQLKTELGSADRIDVVMAFIRKSGIVALERALRRHCERHRGGVQGDAPLRVLTTVYTGSTEARALDALCALGAEVRSANQTGRDATRLARVRRHIVSRWRSLACRRGPWA